MYPRDFHNFLVENIVRYFLEIRRVGIKSPTWHLKTVTSLNFPDPVVIDYDGGTDWYTKVFKFKRLRTTDVDQSIQAIDELIKDPAGAKTVVIDSMTKFWELMQEKHLKRLRVKKGNPAYTFQPIDYKAIKGDVKSFINKLLALDLNIVATAQSKNVYSQDSGEFMKVVDTEPDGPKEAPLTCIDWII